MKHSPLLSLLCFSLSVPCGYALSINIDDELSNKDHVILDLRWDFEPALGDFATDISRDWRAHMETMIELFGVEQDSPVYNLTINSLHRSDVVGGFDMWWEADDLNIHLGPWHYNLITFSTFGLGFEFGPRLDLTRFDPLPDTVYGGRLAFYTYPRFLIPDVGGTAWLLGLVLPLLMVRSRQRRAGITGEKAGAL